MSFRNSIFRFFRDFPQHIPVLHSFCTWEIRFSLERWFVIGQSSHTQNAKVLSILLDRREVWQCLAILEGELPGGFQKASETRTGCPGVAASSENLFRKKEI